MSAIDSPVLTFKETMAYLKRGSSWLKKNADRIGVVRDGGKLSFLRADLDAYLARNRTQTQPEAAPRSIQSARRKHDGISVLTGRPFRSPAVATQRGGRG